MIRTATIDELDRFSHMACAFAHRAGRKVFSKEAFIATWKRLLASGCGHIWGRFVDGVPRETISVIVYPDMCSHEVHAQFGFWHIEDMASGLEGGLLYQVVIGDLQKMGVTPLFYEAIRDLNFDRVKGFLENAGFRSVGEIFRKDL